VPRDLRIVLPVSGIARGKSRLAAVLSSGERARLNEQLLDHALSIAFGVLGESGGCIVVSPCVRARRIAHLAGVSTLAQARPLRGLNAAVRQGLRYAMRQGARRVLVLPVDLPRLSVPALGEVMRAARAGTKWLVVPDRDRHGTNVLLLPARLDVRTQFGEHSFERHLHAAKVQGPSALVSGCAPLMQDLDTPEHLADWIAAGRRWG
jgi:2-phospho-L-lactate guanylyltransferase